MKTTWLDAQNALKAMTGRVRNCHSTHHFIRQKCRLHSLADTTETYPNNFIFDGDQGFKSCLQLSSGHSPPMRPHLVTSRRCPVSLAVASRPSIIFASSAYEKLNPFTTTRAQVISDSNSPTTFTFDCTGGGCVILPDSGRSGDSYSCNSGGGDDSNEGMPLGEGGDRRKPVGLSFSQKLTLGYAGLVVVGGVAMYLRPGNVCAGAGSLASSLSSAFVLGWVCKLLPRFPVQASLLGFVVSAMLMVVSAMLMVVSIILAAFLPAALTGGRSVNVFPDGVLIVTSLVMSVGYLLGMIRSFL